MKTHVDEQVVTGLSLSTRLKIAVAFFAFILIGANDGAFGVLLPGIQAHYQIDVTTLGTLFLSSTVGYLIGSFNNGLLIEKLGHARFLMLGATVFLLGTGVVSLMPPFTLLLVAFLILGIGVALLDPALNSYITSLPHSVTLLNYLHAFYGVGAWLSPLLASALIVLQWGWNSVYVIWLGLSILLLAGFCMTFRGQGESGAQEDREGEAVKGNVMVMALKQRVVWLAALFLLFYVGAEVSLGNWSFSFLTETRHGPTLQSGWIVSGYWFGLTLGRVVLARVAQRVGNRSLIQGCLVGVVIGLSLVWLVPVQAAAAIGLGLTGFSLGPIYPTTIALMPKLVTARLLPSAIGFMASISAVGGSLFPWTVGNLSQRLGLWALLPFVILLTGGMLFIWLALLGKPSKAENDAA